MHGMSKTGQPPRSQGLQEQDVLTTRPLRRLWLSDPALLEDPLFFMSDTLNASGLGFASSEKVGEYIGVEVAPFSDIESRGDRIGAGGF